MVLSPQKVIHSTRSWYHSNGKLRKTGKKSQKGPDRNCDPPVSIWIINDPVNFAEILKKTLPQMA